MEWEIDIKMNKGAEYFSFKPDKRVQSSCIGLIQTSWVDFINWVTWFVVLTLFLYGLNKQDITC